MGRALLRRKYPKLVTIASLRAAYRFLARTAFREAHMPRVREVQFTVRKMRKFHGRFEWHRDGTMVIVIDSQTPTGSTLLYHMAHEMCHLILHIAHCRDHEHHGSSFKRLVAYVSRQMGWPRGAV